MYTMNFLLLERMKYRHGAALAFQLAYICHTLQYGASYDQEDWRQLWTRRISASY